MTAPSTVVALGDVDPGLVVEHLPSAVRFVTDPSGPDLAVAAGAIVRADVDVDAGLLARMPALRVLARTGVGTDRIDLSMARERGITVVITPGTGTNAVAETTLAMMLHLVKGLAPSTASVRAGRWAERASLDVGDLEGATLGVVGFGRIGRRVAYLARAFGMHVVAHDPFVDDVADLVDLDQLCACSDVISLHLPLTEETRRLVDRDFLAGLPFGAVLVNCSRGGLVDLDAVLEALDVGRLGGLGLDVFETEPPEHHAVFDNPNVVLAPHVAGLSRRATVLTFAEAARGVADVLAGQEPTAVARTSSPTA